MKLLRSLKPEERLVRNEKARGSNPLTSKAAGVEVKVHEPGLLLDALAGA